ncbi:putative G3BP-like protein [Coffea eugenioides]|uniref:putative G3BP-like protein n=1 Tax=Coffea eugenioides TaxID=49369 RepID=UPI000F60727B|nr:putative G3BP-like protein [Coffea eugenioides]
MATPFHLPVTAAQVGTYFVGQYYQVLQQQPEFVHQFYSDASTVLRIDGNTRDTATSMLHIHTLIMSLNYTAIEIKTAHSLESWNGGVLVMVSGSVHVKDFKGRRKFVQTFFLAPQEKGYFVLNDIFHFVDDENHVQHSVAYLPQSNLDSKLNAPTGIREQVPNYVLGGDIQGREFIAASTIEENGPVDSYNFPDERLKNVPEADNILEDNFAVQSNGSLQSAMNSVQDHLSIAVDEPVGEPQKHTYASIVAKGQTAQAIPPQSAFNKNAPASTDWHHVSDPPSQLPIESSNSVERTGMDHVEEASGAEDEVEVKSVYVRNVPTTMGPSEIEEEFKKFGRLKPDGVAIRTRKDIDICYAFVEFEDIAGVQNAIKASTVQIAGHQLYIEGRRPNRGIPIRGRGRGRGRISYQMDGARGRFGGRGFGRGNSQDGNDRDYIRPRANGFYRQGPRQERVFSSSHQGLRNGQSSSE